MNKIKKWYDSITCKSNILAFLVLVAFASIAFADKNFLSANNIVNILTKAAKNGGMLAFGMTFVILLGQIDGVAFAPAKPYTNCNHYEKLYAQLTDKENVEFTLFTNIDKFTKINLSKTDIFDAFDFLSNGL